MMDIYAVLAAAKKGECIPSHIYESLLARKLGGGASTELTVTGISPIMLANAIAKPLVSLIQYGKCVQNGTPTPSAPVDIVCNNGTIKWDSVNQRIYTDGTDEVLTVIGKNLYDGATMLNHGYAIRGGSPTETIPRGAMFAARQWSCSDYIRVAPETDYTITIPQSTAASGAGLAFYADRSVESTISGLTQNSGLIRTVTTPQGCNYIRFSWQNISDDGDNGVQLEIGNTATEVVPYTAQTASVVDLYSVGDITDEQEIISGAVTHRISCHVFDGTETFSKSTAYGKAFLINAASATWGADRTQEVLCTHFLGLPQTKSSQDDNTCFFNQTGHFYFRVVDNSDTDAFKTWLAEQYAAGTPVIVWFVLAEQTTESVAPQELRTSEGANVVSVEANVSGITLEAKYKGKSA